MSPGAAARPGDPVDACGLCAQDRRTADRAVRWVWSGGRVHGRCAFHEGSRHFPRGLELTRDEALVAWVLSR